MNRADYLLVAIGGALGSVARVWAVDFVALRWGTAFPIGTLLVNVLGSLAIGYFAAFTGPGGRVLLSDAWRLAFMAGVCGGFTTFSAFSLQTLSLALAGAWPRAGLNVLASIVLCLTAVWLGWFAAVHMNPVKTTP